MIPDIKFPFDFELDHIYIFKDEFDISPPQKIIPLHFVYLSRFMKESIDHLSFHITAFADGLQDKDVPPYVDSVFDYSLAGRPPFPLLANNPCPGRSKHSNIISSMPVHETFHHGVTPVIDRSMFESEEKTKPQKLPDVKGKNDDLLGAEIDSQPSAKATAFPKKCSAHVSFILSSEGEQWRAAIFYSARSHQSRLFGLMRSFEDEIADFLLQEPKHLRHLIKALLVHTLNDNQRQLNSKYGLVVSLPRECFISSVFQNIKNAKLPVEEHLLALSSFTEIFVPLARAAFYSTKQFYKAYSRKAKDRSKAKQILRRERICLRMRSEKLLVPDDPYSLKLPIKKCGWLWSSVDKPLMFPDYETAVMVDERYFKAMTSIAHIEAKDLGKSDLEQEEHSPKVDDRLNFVPWHLQNECVQQETFLDPLMGRVARRHPEIQRFLIDNVTKALMKVISFSWTAQVQRIGQLGVSLTTIKTVSIFLYSLNRILSNYGIIDRSIIVAFDTLRQIFARKKFRHIFAKAATIFKNAFRQPSRVANDGTYFIDMPKDLFQIFAKESLIEAEPIKKRPEQERKKFSRRRKSFEHLREIKKKLPTVEPKESYFSCPYDINMSLATLCAENSYLSKIGFEEEKASSRSTVQPFQILWARTLGEVNKSVIFALQLAMKILLIRRKREIVNFIFDDKEVLSFTDDGLIATINSSTDFQEMCESVDQMYLCWSPFIETEVEQSLYGREKQKLHQNSIVEEPNFIKFEDISKKLDFSKLPLLEKSIRSLATSFYLQDEFLGDLRLSRGITLEEEAQRFSLIKRLSLYVLAARLIEEAIPNLFATQKIISLRELMDTCWKCKFFGYVRQHLKQSIFRDFIQVLAFIAINKVCKNLNKEQQNMEYYMKQDAYDYFEFSPSYNKFEALNPINDKHPILSTIKKIPFFSRIFDHSEIHIPLKHFIPSPFYCIHLPSRSNVWWQRLRTAYYGLLADDTHIPSLGSSNDASSERRPCLNHPVFMDPFESPDFDLYFATLRKTNDYALANSVELPGVLPFGCNSIESSVWPLINSPVEYKVPDLYCSNGAAERLIEHIQDRRNLTVGKLFGKDYSYEFITQRKQFDRDKECEPPAKDHLIICGKVRRWMVFRGVSVCIYNDMLDKFIVNEFQLIPSVGVHVSCASRDEANPDVMNLWFTSKSLEKPLILGVDTDCTGYQVPIKFDDPSVCKKWVEAINEVTSKIRSKICRKTVLQKERNRQCESLLHSCYIWDAANWQGKY
eukprot:GHVP01020825.1.p1 GENE.GHVP01020825.1~~GHVP01020825.1.p1  ORF type:complete len:1255 (+),score=199.42 GHVP01020825.1:2858-6622(+)